MKGLKIRVPDVPAYMAPRRPAARIRRRSRSPRCISRCRTGPVDAQENPLTTIEAKKFYEVQKAIMMTSHTARRAHDAGRAARVEQADRPGESRSSRKCAAKRGARHREDQEARASSPRSSGRKACRSVQVDRKSFIDAVLKSADAGVDGLLEADYDAIVAIK
jgi:hypothetical protein